MSSDYCTQTNMTVLFGANAIDTWADIDGVSATKTTRINLAIDLASDEIDAVLRTTKYSGQLPIVDADGNTPLVIQQIAARLASAYLYDGRGGIDRDTDGHFYHNLEFARQWAREMLERIRKGEIELDAVS